MKPPDSRCKLISDMRFPRLILIATAAQFVVGAVVAAGWMWTGDVLWERTYFQYQGAAFLVGASVLELSLCLRSWRQFSPGETLRSAWLWLSLGAACHVAGTTCAEILGVRSHLNPLLMLGANRSQMTINHLRWLGLMVSGPLRWLLILGGLFLVLRVYRRSGILPKLEWADRLLISALTIYTLLEASGVWIAIQSGRHFRITEKITWLNDPLLLLLLVEAIWIRRCVLATGWGLVSRCWGAFVAAIALTGAGDLGLWAHSYAYLPWQAQATTWHVWLLSSAAFALAPAYQVEAGRRIRGALYSIAQRRRAASGAGNRLVA